MNSHLRPVLVLSFSIFISVPIQAEVAARFHLADADQFIQQRIEPFAINARTHDPFGQPQDLTEKVVEEGSAEEVERPEEPAEEEKVMLEINKLQGKVSVMGDGFVLGNAYYRKNSSFKVRTEGEEYSLEVLKVSKGMIVFRDRETKKRMVLVLDGKGRVLKPGEEPELNAPVPLIDLDK